MIDSMTPELNVEVVGERVERGREVLDRYAPDWRTRVDWERLNMGDTSWCVLGQVVRNGDPALHAWIYYVDAVSGDTVPYQDLFPWSVRHGFCAGEHDLEWVVLAQLWTAEGARVS